MQIAYDDTGADKSLPPGCHSSRVDMRSTPFHLVTAFPPSTLSDSSATIADAGLVGAVVIQKL